MAFLKITWRRSAIGSPQKHRRIIEALGLKRLAQSVVHRDSPGIRGMVEKVSHLVDVIEVDSAEATSRGGGVS